MSPNWNTELTEKFWWKKSKGSVAYNLYKKMKKKVIFAWNWNMSKRNKKCYLTLLVVFCRKTTLKPNCPCWKRTTSGKKKWIIHFMRLWFFPSVILSFSMYLSNVMILSPLVLFMRINCRALYPIILTLISISSFDTGLTAVFCILWWKIFWFQTVSRPVCHVLRFAVLKGDCHC